MSKNALSWGLPRLAAIFLSLFVVGRLYGANVVNLTAQALAQSCLEYVYGPQHGNVAVPNFIFTESNANNGRFIGSSGTYPTYLAVHLTDNYESGQQLAVSRLYLAVNPNQASYATRAPRQVVLQGSNSSAAFSTEVGSAGSDLSDSGWSDIKEFGSDSTEMEWAMSSDGKLYEFSGDIEGAAPYRYYRLKIIRTRSNAHVVFTQFRLYGKVLSDRPVGLTASFEPDEDSVEVSVGVEAFDETNMNATGTVYLDYGLDLEFTDGSYTRLTLATDVSHPQGNWADSVLIENLSPGTSYHGRLTVVNGSGRTSESVFSFATIRPLYVDATGDDATGDGSELQPYRSITKALSVATGIPLVVIGAGTYSAESGEAFPIAVPSGAILRGAGAAATTISGGNAGASLVRNAAHGEACRISGIHFADSGLAPAIDSVSTDLVVERCSFSQSLKSSGTDETAGAIRISGASSTTIDGCEFSLGSETRHWVVQTSGSGGADDILDLTVRDCTFYGNTVAYGIIGCGQDSIHNRYTISDCTFEENTVTAYSRVGTRSLPGGIVLMVSLCDRSNANTPYGELTVDRCRFVSNTANSVIGVHFSTDRANVFVRNSLFKENAMYNTTGTGHLEGVVRTYYSVPTVANCTFIGNGGHFCEAADGEFRNCIFVREGDLVANLSNRMRIYGAIVYDTGYGNFSQIVIDQETGGTIADDPCFADESGRLRPYSPAVDAGTGTFGLTDLDGNLRVVNSTGTATARCDYGCYESQYGAETTPSFRMPSYGRVAQQAGRAQTVTVTLAAAEDVALPLTATVTYPAGAGFAGPATLEFTSATAELSYTTPDAEGSYDIVVSASGVASGLLRVEVADDSVTLFGDRLKFFHVGDGATEVAVAMSSNGATADEDIAVELVSVTGDGTTTVAWSADGACKIAAGEHETTARLVFTPGTGRNQVTLRVGTTFRETGTDVLVLDVIAATEALFVAASAGSDTTGVGTEDAPFKSVTKALSYAASGDTVRIAAGAYSASATGEAFPFSAAGVRLVGDAGGTVIDGENAVASLFSLEGNEAALSATGLTLANTLEAVANLVDGYIAMTNCRVVQTRNDNDAPAIAYMFRASKIEMADCVYETDLENLSRQSAFSLTTTDADIQSASRTKDRWIDATRCRFRNLRFERGLVTSLRPNGTPYVASFSDCTFDGLRMYTVGSLPGGGDNVYYYGVFHLPTGTQSGHSVCALKVERSRFLSLKCSALASVSHCVAPEFSNCLFADVTNSIAVVWGNAIGQTNSDPALFRGCTFVRTTGAIAAYSASSGNGVGADVRNTIIVDGEIASSADTRLVTLSDSILFNTSLGDYAEGNVTVGDNVRIGTDPMLRNIGVAGNDPSFNAAIGALSPAFDAGNDAYMRGGLDLLGNPRKFGRSVDVGAVECQQSSGFLLIVR